MHKFSISVKRFDKTPITEKYEDFMNNIKESNKLFKNKHYRSTYKCLGRQNMFEAMERRSCLFRNVCYDVETKEFRFYLPSREPVFYDRTLGPMYAFNSPESPHFIRMTAIPYWNTETFFTPVVKIGAPQDYKQLDQMHVLFAPWAHEFNMGHFVFEELGSAFVAMKRFGNFDPEAILVNMWGDVDNGMYHKLVKGFAPAISSKPIVGLESYLKSHGKQTVCFDKLLVASATRNFLSYKDTFNEGKEPIWFDFRARVLQSHGIDPAFIPKKHKIVLIKKVGSMHGAQPGQTHFRDIYNLDEIHQHLKSLFPDIPVDIISPGEMTIPEQLQVITNTTILITPPGGISMLIPFLPQHSHAIIMDYLGMEDEPIETKPGESVSMEVSFWNLFPHIRKQYYQIMNPDLELSPDFPGATNYREAFSVIADKERIKYMVNLAIKEIKI
ncbi:hypothetical protein EDD86DRAFT_259977 [Gorgonomyces haynaldii]|nr:hypothetical protein EDD86DRAFT_259977 [Gorgonomyces haynaldii]